MIKSIAFPNMLNHNKIQVIDNDYDSTLQAIKLTLGSEKGEFKFDPYFGIRLKRYMFEQNNFVLQDLLLDEIYEQLVNFVPQIIIKRKDISFTKERGILYINIKCINKIDFNLNTYNLVLFENQD